MSTGQQQKKITRKTQLKFKSPRDSLIVFTNFIIPSKQFLEIQIENVIKTHFNFLISSEG